MSVQVVIRDGDPYWYLSPDIWVVPGSDPAGPPGSPVAGQPAYLWARVANTGSTDADSVRVDFYWANPALQVTRSNATFIGSSYADVPAGGSQETLLLNAWLPVSVNGGHECLIAVANQPDDPLPSPLPDAFDPPAYRQVAQKNLTVLMASERSLMLTLTLSGLQRADKKVAVIAEVGGELDERTLASLGLSGLRPAREPVVDIGLDHQPHCVSEQEPLGEHRLDLHLPRGTSKQVYLKVRAKNLAKHEYQLVHLIERNEERILGGLALVVVSESMERKEKRS